MSVRFDAAADRLLRTTDLLDYNAAYTWMAWIYLVSDLNANSTFWTLNSNSATNLDTIWTSADGTTLECRVTNAGSTTTVAGSALTLATPYHVAAVRESVTSLKIYLDGVLSITNTRDVTARTVPTRMEHGALRSTNLNPSDSRVDRIKAWSAALTIDEVNAERWQIRPQRTSGLYGFWPTFTGSGERARDYSGNARDWTESGTLTDEDPAPVGWRAASTRLIVPTSAAAVSLIAQDRTIAQGVFRRVFGRVN